MLGAWSAWIEAAIWQASPVVAAAVLLETSAGRLLRPWMRIAILTMAFVKLIWPTLIPRVDALWDHQPLSLPVSKSEVLHGDWVVTALCVWGAGLICFVGHAAWQRWRWTIEVQSRVRPAPERWQCLARSLARRLGMRRAPFIGVSAETDSPMVVGCLAPRVLIPMRDLSTSDASIEATLSHEFAHIRRYHLALRSAAAVVFAIYWWHPLVWWWRHRLYVATEMDADEQATIACGRDRYRRELLLAAERTLRAVEARRPLTAHLLGSGFGERLRRLDRCRVSPLIAIPALALLLSVLTLSLTLDPKGRRAQAMDRAANVITSKDERIGSLHRRYAEMQLRALRAEGS